MHSLDLQPLIKYPHYPNEYGIDFSAIKTERAQSLMSDSGRDLLVKVDYGLVEVSDMSRWSSKRIIKMAARVIENQITFGLYNRDFNAKTGDLGSRHPDFEAMTFALLSYDFFSTNRQTDIESMFSSYDHNSYTAWQYWQARKDNDPIEAAKLTWDAKLAKELKFDKLTVDDEGSSVIVVWSR